MPSLTRREFLRSLVPAWLTARLILTAIVAAAAVFVAVRLAAVVRVNGFVASARIAGVLVSVGIAAFLLSKLASMIRRAVAGASEDFRSFASNLSRAFEFLVAMSVGAFLYARWSAGGDVISTIIVLALGFVVALFRDEKKG